MRFRKIDEESWKRMNIKAVSNVFALMVYIVFCPKIGFWKIHISMLCENKYKKTLNGWKY